MAIAKTKRKCLLVSGVEMAMQVSQKIGVRPSSMNGSSIIIPVGWFRKGSYLNISDMWQVHAFMFLNYKEFGLPPRNHCVLLLVAFMQLHLPLGMFGIHFIIWYNQVYMLVAQKCCLAEWWVDECCQLFGFAAVILAWYSLRSHIDHREQPDLSYSFVTVDAIII